MKRSVRTVLVVLILVTFTNCTNAPTIIGLLFAFRKAEHAAMTSPYLQSKITDVSTQTKINALEADVDIAFNCLLAAYEKAAQGVPEGQPVNVGFSDWSACASNGWAAAFQLITTVRAFDPNFLSGVLTFNVPSTTGKSTPVTYEPTYFQSATPPGNLALGPSKGQVVFTRSR
jgi:hypothetical protein